MSSAATPLGEIQAHGVLLAVAEHDLAIVAASTNTLDWLGIDHARLLGAGLDAVFADASVRRVRNGRASDSDVIELTTREQRRFDAVLHRASGLLLIELVASDEAGHFGDVTTLIDRLRRAQSGGDVARVAASELRALTGFDRVGVYRVRGNLSELIAEDVAEGATVAARPCSLGPDEDLRYVPDPRAPHVPLVPAAPLAPGAIDLAGALLRTSRTQLGPGSGASLELRLPGWGYISCEHQEARLISCRVVFRATLLARLAALQLVTREQLTDELRASNLAKDEFLATVSHELRTPLNAMLGWLRLIEAGQVAPDRQARALSTVTRNAHALAQLVDELLDVSRIISGNMRLDVRPVAAGPIVEAAIAAVQPTAEAKFIRIATQLDQRADAVLADPRRLQQIVWNLLSNAVKFTPESGEIEVRLRTANQAIEISVEDNGIGIEPSLLPYVFDRFRQGGGHEQRSKGLGLGLSIVRHLVELHGGSVTAASDGPGAGATFTVRMPIAGDRETTGTVPLAPAFEPDPQLSGLRVLSVDDEHDANDLVRAVLEACGVEVTVASNAADVLALLPKLRPHVLISDINMPGLDGYELIQQVRSLPDSDGGRIPAVAITASARRQDRSRAFLAGFDVFLAKPIDPAELVATLVNVSTRRPPARPADRPPAMHPNDLSAARILLVDDDLDSCDLLAELLGRAGATVATAHTAAAAQAELRRFRPDVLVCDLELPDKSGLDLVRELRATGADDGGWIPAIAVSGHAGPEHARDAILAGFQLHVAKPIDARDLIARLGRLVGRTARRT